MTLLFCVSHLQKQDTKIQKKMEKTAEKSLAFFFFFFFKLTKRDCCSSNKSTGCPVPGEILERGGKKKKHTVMSP